MKPTRTHFTLPFFFLFIFFSVHSPVAKAQRQNALACDGTDDKVTTTGASSLISGAAGISLACWVYPTNSASTGYPDFDGFAGFRNETDADFYMLQLSPSLSLEARFRNSTGTFYTITNTCLTFNTWQHLVFTYDGSKLRLYKNGAQIDSVTASGSISNSAVNFMAGAVFYTSQNFYLKGKIDEIGLWNRALAASEINCIYHSPINTSSSGLKLYYNCNQGIPGGTNTGLTTLNDATGHLNGTLSGFALSGTTSNWVTGVNNVTGISDSICAGQTYTFGTQTLAASGVYQRALTAASGCDSVIELTLQVNDTSVVQNVNSLHANQSGATYQWLNCNTGYSPVNLAISQNYTPPGAGSFAVIITHGSCSDTSACKQFIPLGITGASLEDEIHVYPNPLENEVSIDFSRPFHRIHLWVTDIEGKEIYQEDDVEKSHLKITTADWARGVYVMHLVSDEKHSTVRLIRK